MAVEAGDLALVKVMLEGLGDNAHGQISSKLEGRKWLVHAALKANNRDILNAIIDKDPSLVKERDEEGRTCLSFGASIGYYKGVCNLLDRSTSSVFVCDDDGSFPIHMAVEKGHVDVVKEILKRCPHSIELLNKQGQNILHIAARSGKAGSFLLKYIKKLDIEKNHLLEEQDADGNTPLHLATINWRPRTVMDLTNVSLNANKIQNQENKDGLRPLDIAELKLHPDYVFRERLTRMILLFTYKPRSVFWLPTNGMTIRPSDGNKYKDQVNILLLVATLVATVTFVAGIAVPGGFNSSPPNLGKSVLAKDINFNLFLLLNSMAMYFFSLGAIVALFWALLGDPEVIHRAFQLALPSLLGAIFLMSAAFYQALLATTVNKDKSFTVSFVGNIIYLPFNFLFSSLLAPYVAPHIPGLRRFKFYKRAYLRILLVLVDEDDTKTRHT